MVSGRSSPSVIYTCLHIRHRETSLQAHIAWYSVSMEQRVQCTFTSQPLGEALAIHGEEDVLLLGQEHEDVVVLPICTAAMLTMCAIPCDGRVVEAPHGHRHPAQARDRPNTSTHHGGMRGTPPPYRMA